MKAKGKVTTCTACCYTRVSYSKAKSSGGKWSRGSHKHKRTSNHVEKEVKEVREVKRTLEGEMFMVPLVLAE